MSSGQGLNVRCCVVLGVERAWRAGCVGGGESFDKILGKRDRERERGGGESKKLGTM